VRLFVAINLPASEQNRLSSELQRVAAALPARWVAAEALHITLKFLGHVSDPAVDQIRKTLHDAVAGNAAFDVALGGFGAFPTLSRPNIFWVAASSPDLLELQARIEDAYHRAGFAKEARAYRPHITVGRLPRNVQLRNRALMDRIAGDFDYKTVFRAKTADLMRSQLSPHGARYEVLERVVLH
jgi:2'-5' RNA ligase